MKVSLKQIKLMVMANYGVKAIIMKGSLRMISLMGWGWRLIRTKAIIKANLRRARNVVRESMFGTMVADIWEVLIMTCSKVMVSSSGRMEGIIKVIGKITRCMVMVSIHGLMEMSIQ